MGSLTLALFSGGSDLESFLQRREGYDSITLLHQKRKKKRS